MPDELLRLKAVFETINRLEKLGYLLEMGRHDPKGRLDPGWYACFLPPNTAECDECCNQLFDADDCAHAAGWVEVIELAAKMVKGEE